jgi:PKD repeat protein
LKKTHILSGAIMKKLMLFILIIIIPCPLIQCTKKERKVIAQTASAVASGFGKITYLLGQVSVVPPGAQAKPASLFEDIASKTVIQTAKASKVVVSLIGVGDIAIGENSEIELSMEKLRGSEKSPQGPSVNYVARNFFGSMFASIKKLTGNQKQFSVATPTATASIRGTSFEVFVNPQTYASKINVIKGVVAVRRNAKPRMVENKPQPPETKEVIEKQKEIVQEILIAPKEPAPSQPSQPAVSAEPPKGISLVNVGESIVVEMQASESQQVEKMSNESFAGMSARVGDKVVKKISEEATGEGVGELASAIIDKPAEVIREAVQTDNKTVSENAVKAVQEAVNFITAPEPVVKEVKNTAPYFTAIKLPAFYALRSQVEIDARAADKEQNPLLYALEGAPEGMAISPFDGRITWVPEKPGLFSFKVRVTDSKGLFALKAIKITVKQQIKASVKVNTGNGIAGKTRFIFDASSTTALGARSSAIQYRFDFDNDGKWDFPGGDAFAASPIAEFIFPKGGDFKVVVEALSESGEKSLADIAVKVDPNFPAAVKTKAVKKANLAQSSEFDGEGSDKNGGIAEYAWDFNNDGTFEFHGPSAKTTHAYGKPGTYTAVLRAISTDNDTALDKVKAEVYDAPPAAKGCEPITIKAGENAHFTGTGTDPDGKIIKYGWDFDGDGTVDWKSAFGADVKYVYKKPGKYRAVLFVKSEQGPMASDTVIVNVE